LNAANSVKGEVKFSAGGQTYRLVFSANALIALEERFDKTVAEIGAMFEQPLRLAHLRILFWAGLSDHHDLPELEAGRLMGEVGIDKVGELIGRAFVLAFPEEQEGAKDGERPQKPAAKKAAGTGKDSTRSGRRPG